MRNGIKKQKSGFTFTEFLVLTGVGSLLLGILAADLTQTRTKLLQQACAANLKHWGMAINLYSQDYSGTYYGENAGSRPWDDTATPGSPYARYLAVSNSRAAIRAMRVCPFIAQYYSQDQIVDGLAIHSYSIPDPQAKWGGIPLYRTATGSSAPASSPFRVYGADWNTYDLPTLTTVLNRSTFLLLFEYGNSMRCGELYSKSITIPSSGPRIRPCDRHGGSVNCLFGDFHVELVSTQTLQGVDASGGCVGAPAGYGNPWFSMN
jgi:prepilin-type processing-associated H-X9-DG protein